jgi:AraC-like DNA-binding protein
MIVREKGETYDWAFKLMMYESDGEGRLAETKRVSDLEDQIPTYYDQRRLELERLERELLAGEISPIAMCMTYQQLTLADLASRAGLSKWRVRRHLTPAGFRDVTVAQLQRYARIFDVTIADLFQFVHVKAGVAVTARQRCERLVQVVDAAPEPGPAAGEPGDERAP